MGHLQRLRGEAPLALRHQPSPLSYELTSAKVAQIPLTKELLDEAGLSEEVARKLLGDLAYRRASS